MSEVYQCAGNILVWLGDSNPSLEKAVDHIQDIGKIHRTEWQETWDEIDVYRAHLRRGAVAV
jgi:hypothetical protein